MSAMRSLVKLILSLAMLYAAYYLGSAGYYILYHAHEFDQDTADTYARLQPAEAKITSAKRRATDNGHFRVYHIWTVDYAFGPIDGKTWTGQFTAVDQGRGYTSPSFNVGDPVSVYYDPKSPSFNQTSDWYERNKKDQGRYGAAWIGAVFMGVALLLLVGGALLLPRAILALLGKTDAMKA